MRQKGPDMAARNALQPPRAGPSIRQIAGDFIRRELQKAQQASCQLKMTCSLKAQVNAVHDIRVGARRIRLALAAFRDELPKKLRRRLSRKMHKLQDQASLVRDLDVWQTELSRLQQGRRYQKAITFALINATTQRRLRAKRLYQSSARLLADDFWQRAAKQLRKSLSKRHRSARDGLEDLMRAQLPQRLSRLEEALEHAGGSDMAALHQTRIAAKQARYTLEIFVDCCPAALSRQTLRYLKEIQDALGNLHDYRTFAGLSRNLAKDAHADQETCVNLERLARHFDQRATHQERAFAVLRTKPAAIALLRSNCRQKN